MKTWSINVWITNRIILEKLVDYFQLQSKTVRHLYTNKKFIKSYRLKNIQNNTYAPHKKYNKVKLQNSNLKIFFKSLQQKYVIKFVWSYKLQ